MKRLLILANLVVALVIAGVVALQVGTDRRRMIEAAYQNAENLTDVLAEHTRQTLAGLELGIATIAESLASPDPEFPALGRVHELLANRQSTSVITHAFFVLDEHGRLVATSRTPHPRPVDLSGVPEFTVHRDGEHRGLYIGPPRLGRVGHAEAQWISNISRRIETRDGRFAGVVAAVLSLDYLLSFYDTLSIGEQGVVGLLSTDGIMIARSPFLESNIGRNMSDTALFREWLSATPRGRFITTYPADGVRRISAYRRVDGKQAIVYVGIGHDEALATWWDRVLFDGAIGTLAVLLFAGGSGVLGLFSARRQQWERQRSERLRILAEESMGLVQCPDIDSLLTRITDLARRLIGAHQAIASLTEGKGLAHAATHVSLSEKYRDWWEYDEWSDGKGIYRLVCERNRPMVMTQAELEAHPAWRGFGAARRRHPPMRGWLAVPIISQDGGNLGLIQLSDKYLGEFSADDVHELTQLASIVGVAVDNLRAIRAREAALAEATEARTELETVLDSISDEVYALDKDWRFVYLNSGAERLMRRSRAELIGKNAWDAFPEARDTILYTEYLRARAENVPVSFEFHYPPFGRWLAVRAFPHENGLTAYIQDITRRVETEERLRQSQKMESIGQLTGGVAHDFNNLLTVMLGSADELVEDLAEAPDDVRTRVELIRQAGERAAELTHRLLAFARRQPLDPRQTDINALIGDFEPILRRTLGETIQIELVRGGGLWKAVVDPHELQSAILNLAVNARDAMPEGGKLTIETANTAIDRDYAETHEIRAGQYVMIAVSDTGTGMSTEVIAKAFDPFFTTKAVGKGSGLGLSMVYGFARQSGGHARIYSEPGEGTTIRLYLPRADSADEPDYRHVEPAPVQRGSEHILVVEDDALVRRHTVHCLQQLGYTVTACEDGPQALARLDTDGPFDLLLSDVVLPGGLSGDRVAAEARARVPDLRVLYMSGYTENAIVHHGRLDRGVQLLGKPFRLADLARKVREVLDGA